MMQCVFTENFKNHDYKKQPYNFIFEKHSPHCHIHGEVKNEVFEIYTGGVRYIPLTPILEEFTLTLDCGIFFTEDKTAACKIYFDYNIEKQEGLCFEIKWLENIIEVELSELFKDNYKSISAKKSEELKSIDYDDISISINKKKDDCRISVSGISFEFDLPQDKSSGFGKVALRKSFFAGFFLLKSVIVESHRELERKLATSSNVEFPSDINGIQQPYFYDIKLFEFCGTYELEVELRGGAFDVEGIPTFPYHGRIIDFLTNPYIRIGRSKEGICYLSNTTFVMGNVPGSYFYKGLYEKPEWPLKRTFRFERNPFEKGIFLGYEYFNTAPSQHLQGGSAEIFADINTGEIKYKGERVLKDEAAIKLSSNPDKKIIKLIPEHDLRYEDAVKFAKNNHYFLEGEGIEFSLEVMHNIDPVCEDELKLFYTLENVFMQPLEEKKACNISKVESNLACSCQAASINLKALEPGVYHINLELYFGDRKIKQLRKAFEILSNDEHTSAPPLLSGLPVLFSSATEMMGIETDPFDPWGADSVDAGHYISVCCFNPEFSREAKIWDVIRIYRRKWFMWLTRRTTPKFSIQENEDILKHCDYVNKQASDSCYHLYLWKWNLYKNTILDIFNRFLISKGEKKIEEMTSDLFEERVLPHWKEWIIYFCDWMINERLPQQKEKLEKLNPEIKRADYGPVNSYTSNYKTGYDMLKRGLDARSGLEKFHNGFYLYEDYPFAAGYAIHAKTYTLITMKTENPELVYYPEIYSPSVQGCPDSAVMYANPPYGTYDYPPHAVKKRVYEYVYATVWHDKNGFSFWNDNGFHARNWKMPIYQNFFKAWGFVKEVVPLKPAKSPAFVFSREVCFKHEDIYRPPAGPYLPPAGELINTAEECGAFAYDVSRAEGNCAGFVAVMDSLQKLSADAVAFLVLPPLIEPPAEIIKKIRELHGSGVGLLCFERVEGLEDIFGVNKLDSPQRLELVKPTSLYQERNFGKAEYPAHEKCESWYKASDADVVLEDESGIPALVCKKNNKALAALWTVPPTLVRRDDFYDCGGYGRENISSLVYNATAYLMSEMNTSLVYTSAGKVIAFYDTDENIRVIISEDAHPEAAESIDPLVTINIKELDADKIKCDRDFSIAENKSEKVSLRLHLEQHESAIITILKEG